MSSAAAEQIEQPTFERDNESKGAEYLTFSLGGEEYGVDILRVQEIRGWEPATRIPNSPSYVKGVVNLRGAIVPIIDLREQFHLGQVEYSTTTVVVVLQVNNDSGQRVMGVVVEAVSDVVNADRAQVQTTPAFGARVKTEFISGLAASEGKMIMLLDVDKLLNSAELRDTEAENGE